MKIICLEEHTSDAAIAKAVAARMAQEAPYMRNAGNFDDDPAALGDRPGLLGFGEALAMASAPIGDRIAAMDANGIDVQVVSLSDDTQLAPANQATDLSRAANDRLAAAVARYPGRLGAFCTLPWQDPDAAVREANRCVRDLGFAATMLSGHPAEDVLIDDMRFDPVLAALADLGMALYIHPGPPFPAIQTRYYSGFSPLVTARLSLFGWGWHNEAGIQVVRLILSGALDRHRRLNIISGHWGEMVPFFLQRLDDALPPAATGLSRSISRTYRDQVWVTPSGMLNLPHFKFIRDVLGSGRIMFSVDYPYLTMTGARRWLEELPVSDDERHAIAHGNAERLLRIS